MAPFLWVKYVMAFIKLQWYVWVSIQADCNKSLFRLGLVTWWAYYHFSFDVAMYCGGNDQKTKVSLGASQPLPLLFRVFYSLWVTHSHTEKQKDKTLCARLHNPIKERVMIIVRIIFYAHQMWCAFYHWF